MAEATSQTVMTNRPDQEQGERLLGLTWRGLTLLRS